MRDHVLLYVNGQPTRVDGADAFLSLSDFLRRRQRLTGTKVVCAEGDCGSCTVLLGRLDGAQIGYAAVTSCIQTMFQLDAAHVVTIEGLREPSGGGSGGGLNPIQRSLVKCQGTQCGFCTPGFVVAMYGLMHEGQPCDAAEVRRGLVGNLCRCTGYDSILRAAAETDRAALQPIDALYPPGPIVAALRQAAAEEVSIDAAGRRFYKPVTVKAAVRFREANHGTSTVSGGTDLGVLQNKLIRPYKVVMSTAGLAELRAIEVGGGVLTVGASASLTEFERATLEHIPELGRFMDAFGSPLIRNAGTIAGNLVTGSPIGDTIPALMVLNAEVELAGVNGRRRVRLADFYTGYRTTVLTPDEIVAAVRIPLPKHGDVLKLYKVARRKDLDISTFGAAFLLRLTEEGVEEVRIAYGGVGPTVLKMAKTEAVLRGQALSAELIERAAAVARDEVKPLSDVRGSEAYRRALAANALRKLWHDVRGGAAVNASGNGEPKQPAGAAPGASRSRKGRG